MRYLKYFVLVGFLLVGLVSSAPAQVSIGVGIGGPVWGGYYGPAPVCTYGYYGYYPYACAPFGYYGPSYFVGGVFIGAGPWYHGYYGRGFYGRGFYGRGSGFGRGYWLSGSGYGYRRGYSFRRQLLGGDSRSGGGWNGSSGSRVVADRAEDGMVADMAAVEDSTAAVAVTAVAGK